MVLKMKVLKKTYILLLLFSFSHFAISSEIDEALPAVPKASRIEPSFTYAVPFQKEDVYEYSAFNLEFSHTHMQPRWVGYFISRERLEGKKFRRHGFAFMPDSNINGGTATNEDYRKSGYDRGHLASARDMAFSRESLKESFLFSNICPQLPRFNRGKWLELEKFARKMAQKYSVIYVITGPIFQEENKSIGNAQVTIPTHFFKALLFYSPERIEAIGFIMPNENLKDSLNFFACSIDEMEAKANIDVFSSLSDEIEDAVEKAYDVQFWFCDEEDSQDEDGD